MALYAQTLPVDRQNNPYSNAVPPFASNAAWSGSFTVSSTVGVNDKTTAVQLMTSGSAINFKWGAGSVTGTAFDGSLSANESKLVAIPINTMFSGGSVVGANAQYGLYSSISIKAVGGGTSSVFAAEY